MAALPTGTVTFLFTDIEGSTRLLQELGDRYASEARTWAAASSVSRRTAALACSVRRRSVRSRNQ